MSIKSFIFSLLMLACTMAEAQTFQKGTVFTSAFVGGGREFGYGLNLEAGIAKRMSVGAQAMLQSNSLLGLSSSAYNRYDVGLRGNFHFGRGGGRLDPYIGVHVGLGRVTQTTANYKLMRFPAFTGQIGFRHIRHDRRLGYFAEFSPNIMVVKGGLTLNIKR